MINKANLKFYLIPAGLLVIILLIILLIPMGNKKANKQNITPSLIPFPTETKPTRFVVPTNGPTPTLIPLRFTGADLSQDIPPGVKLFSEQKTELRRKIPLTLSFGIISFDYENDTFILTLSEPKDQSQITFTGWLQQNYPALTEDKFIFN